MLDAITGVTVGTLGLISVAAVVRLEIESLTTVRVTGVR